MEKPRCEICDAPAELRFDPHLVPIGFYCNEHFESLFPRFVHLEKRYPNPFVRSLVARISEKVELR